MGLNGQSFDCFFFPSTELYKSKIRNYFCQTLCLSHTVSGDNSVSETNDANCQLPTLPASHGFIAIVLTNYHSSGVKCLCSCWPVLFGWCGCPLPSWQRSPQWLATRLPPNNRFEGRRSHLEFVLNGLQIEVARIAFAPPLSFLSHSPFIRSKLSDQQLTINRNG